MIVTRYEYIKERNRIVRQYLRTKARLYELKSRYKVLSPAGYEELGSLKAKLSTTENLIDTMDNMFGMPYCSELKIIESEDISGECKREGFSQTILGTLETMEVCDE